MDRKAWQRLQAPVQLQLSASSVTQVQKNRTESICRTQLDEQMPNYPSLQDQDFDPDVRDASSSHQSTPEL